MNAYNTIIEDPGNNEPEDGGEIINSSKSGELQNDSPADLTPGSIASNPLQQFLKAIPLAMRQGGTPAALIFALGAIACPLAILQGNTIAIVLAGGAVAVAVIGAIGTIICQAIATSKNRLK
jgi:hypothetical protein